MGVREFIVKSGKVSLVELAQIISDMTPPNRSYDMLPVKIQFQKDFAWQEAPVGEPTQIRKGEEYLLIQGDGNLSITEFYNHMSYYQWLKNVPVDIATSLEYHNTLDMVDRDNGIDMYKAVKEDRYQSVEAMINGLQSDRVYNNVSNQSVNEERKKSMKYSIKVNEVTNSEGSLKGYASVTLNDSFKLSNIRIFENQETGSLFVTMPSYKTSEIGENGENIYKDIFNPITKETRDELYSNILDTYRELHDHQAGRSNRITVNERDTAMPDFSVRVTPYEREGSNVRGLASIYFDNSIVVNNVTVNESRDGKLYVNMPSYKSSQSDEHGKPVYKDFCNPVTAKFREKLYGEIINTYQQTKEQQKDSLMNKLDRNKDAVGAKSAEDRDKVIESPDRSER